VIPELVDGRTTRPAVASSVSTDISVGRNPPSSSILARTAGGIPFVSKSISASVG
jgi:hypothetical protein